MKGFFGRNKVGGRTKGQSNSGIAPKYPQSLVIIIHVEYGYYEVNIDTTTGLIDEQRLLPWVNSMIFFPTEMITPPGPFLWSIG